VTPEQAVDVIFDIFKAAWDLTGFPAVYADKEGRAPSAESVWARPVVQHATGGQSSLAGAIGSRRFTETGTFIAQIFTPVGDGRTEAYRASLIVRDAFRDARHPNVWFRNVRIVEAGDEGAFTQTNVLATFSYDEVR
jgi:hypothetical protein